MICVLYQASNEGLIVSRLLTMDHRILRIDFRESGDLWPVRKEVRCAPFRFSLLGSYSERLELVGSPCSAIFVMSLRLFA